MCQIMLNVKLACNRLSFSEFKSICMRDTDDIALSCASSNGTKIGLISLAPQNTSIFRYTGVYSATDLYDNGCRVCNVSEEKIPFAICSAAATQFPVFERRLRQACDGEELCNVPISNVSMNLICDDCDVTEACFADCISVAYECQEIEGTDYRL